MINVLKIADTGIFSQESDEDVQREGGMYHR